MMYALNDLLTKMGAPETKDKGHMRWHYFDKDNNEIAGFAEVTLLEGGKRLVAELQHLRHNYEDEMRQVHDQYSESFYMHAERTGMHYKVTKIAFDGEEYAHPQKSVIELGLSLFHSRALDISILMVEQAFNKQDILSPALNEGPRFRDVPPLKSSRKKESWGLVVPFRPRDASRIPANH
ncbi:MAG: hypothetical protein HY052_07945 [Proteobacteria bacterium]|nr:hypothetical protein [Pseudomonadota bacterium]